MHPSFELIENAYMRKEERVECHRSRRIREGIDRGLVLLPPWKNVSQGRLITSVRKYTQKNATSAVGKYKHIVYALLEFSCAAIAWQNHIHDVEKDS